MRWMVTKDKYPTTGWRRRRRRQRCSHRSVRPTSIKMPFGRAAPGLLVIVIVSSAVTSGRPKLLSCRAFLLITVKRLNLSDGRDSNSSPVTWRRAPLASELATRRECQINMAGRELLARTFLSDRRGEREPSQQINSRTTSGNLYLLYFYLGLCLLMPLHRLVAVLGIDRPNTPARSSLWTRGQLIGSGGRDEEIDGWTRRQMKCKRGLFKWRKETGCSRNYYRNWHNLTNGP